MHRGVGVPVRRRRASRVREALRVRAKCASVSFILMLVHLILSFSTTTHTKCRSFFSFFFVSAMLICLVPMSLTKSLLLTLGLHFAFALHCCHISRCPVQAPMGRLSVCALVVSYARVSVLRRVARVYVRAVQSPPGQTRLKPGRSRTELNRTEQNRSGQIRPDQQPEQ